MKLLLAAFGVVAALSSVVKALDRYNLLKVAATVHSDYRIETKYDDAVLERKERHCKKYHVQDGSDSGDEVCGSNGKKYKNLSEFNLHKCLIKAQEDTVMTVMDMTFCMKSESEDMEHVEDENSSSDPIQS